MKDQFEWLNMLPVVMFADPEPSSPGETALGCLGITLAMLFMFGLCNLNTKLGVLVWGVSLFLGVLLFLLIPVLDSQPSPPEVYHPPRRPTAADIKARTTTSRRQVETASQIYLEQVDLLINKDRGDE